MTGEEGEDPGALLSLPRPAVCQPTPLRLPVRGNNAVLYALPAEGGGDG